MINITPHQREALRIDKSISLTANAGSGKTFVLSQRFLQIILNTETPLHKIAAITFTEKAAGELYKRISDELDKLLISTIDIDVKTKVEKVRKRLVSANISTIHSFCINLLKEYPVEANLDANFITLNEQKADELVILSIENTIKQLLRNSNNSSNIKLLIRLLGSYERLADELAELIKRRKNVLKLIENIYSKTEDDIAEYYFKIFEENLRIIYNNVLEDKIIHLKKINDKVLELDSTNEIALETKNVLDKINIESSLVNNLIELKRISSRVTTQKNEVRTRGYLKADSKASLHNSIKVVEEFFSEISEIQITENHHAIEKELARYTSALVNVFKNVLIEYENQKMESGALDFEDILLCTKQLLQNESVKRSLSEKFNYLLIDEYQDTNEIQYEIFLPLLNDLKTGNLFIVGDEKQSIYRFRDADLQVFSKTKHSISSIYGSDSLLTLPDSFRMSPAICLFVNSIFKNLFSQSRIFFNEVSASDLVCARSVGFPGKIELLFTDEDKTDEADLTAKKIIDLKNNFNNRFNNLNDIAVLVRKRASFIELQKAFIKYRIPFNIVGGIGFYQRQSISDIYNYFAFLLNEKDDAALIGVLRSPFFLISDIKILELTDYEGETYWDKMKQAATLNPKEWQKNFETIKENKELVSRVSMSFLLRKIFSESNFIAVLSSRVNADQELSNINKLISLSNEFFNNEFRTLFDYVTFLKNAIDHTPDEAQGSIETGNKGVNLLTIHQAKGLEFPVVFLYGCSETTPLNKVKSKSFTIDKDFGILTKIPLNEDFFNDYVLAPIVGLYNLIEERKELAELKRLLYVGLTRAKDFLCITQTGDISKAKKYSFSSLLAAGLNLDLSKDNVVLNGELNFLKHNDGEYQNIAKQFETTISIIRNIELSELKLENNIPDKIENKKINLSVFKDHSKEEVISATRFSTFSNCPIKYNLIYNYKVGNLLEQSKKFHKKYEINLLEDYNKNELDSVLLDDKYSTNEYSRFKGNIIHYILRKNIQKEVVSNYLEELLTKSRNDEIPEKVKNDIIKDLYGFYDSDEFKTLNSFTNYKNEFEVYLKNQDFYLFGIIDRIIFDDNRTIIIDYKTDDITESEIESRASKYLPQLKFYAYIIQRLLKNRFEIKGKVIFIKHPDKPVLFEYDSISDRTVDSGIQYMISSIRSNNYSVNMESCKDCLFADENKRCIIIGSEIIKSA